MSEPPPTSPSAQAPAAPAQVRRRRRWPLVTLGVLLALVAGLAACEWAGWPFVKAPAERWLSERLQRDIAFGERFSLRLLGRIRVASDAFVISPPMGDAALAGAPSSFVDAGDVRLVVPYGTLFGALRSNGSERPAPRISALEVGRLDAQLWRDGQGRANWQFGGVQQEPQASPGLPQFDRLVVRDGRIRVDDAPSKLKLDAEVRTDEGEAAPQGAGLHVSGKGSYEGRALEFRATSSGAMPIAASDAGSPPLPLTLAGSMGQAKLEFDGHAADIVHLRALDGDYTLSGPSLSAVGDAIGVTLPTTAAFKMNGKLRKADQVWSTDVASLSVGASRLAGEFSYDPRPEVPLLNGSLRGERLVLADLAPAIGAPPRPTRATSAAAAARRSGVERSEASGRNTSSERASSERGAAAARGTPAERGKAASGDDAGAQDDEAAGGTPAAQNAAAGRGKPAAGARGNRILPQREFDIPSLRAMNASVKIALRELDLSTEMLEPFRPLEGMLTLNNGLLKLDELKAGAAGGRVAGMLSLDSQPSAPVFATDLKWSGVDLDRWLTVRNPNAKADGEPRASAGDGANGKPGAGSAAKPAAGSRSGRAAVAKDAAPGRSQANSRQPRAATGYLSGSLGGEAKLRGSGRSTAAILASLDGSASAWIRDGSLSHLAVEAIGLDIAQGLGLLVVGDEQLPLNCAAARFVAKRGELHNEVGVFDTRDSTIFTSGSLSLADERLALVLTARPKDFSPLTLRAPLRVEGTFADPDVRLDGKTIGLKVLAAAALAAINPLAALIPLMDLGDAEQRNCREALAERQFRGRRR